jgi:peroxiredoxin (alkyl hydroperoxide reductase subunit C)
MSATTTEPAPTIPRINERAPAFRARTTLGPRSLADFAGSWLVLFSHPADFTPVCTSEFIAFARAEPRFRAVGCQLLALSVDSLYAHLAWVRAIRERFGVDIPFPVVEDVSMVIARTYGMLHPQATDTSAVRSTFVIDPEGLVRATLHYPMTTGRNVAEILRLVQALQISDRDTVSTPEGWQPGGPVLDPPPQTVAEAASSLREGQDWYYRIRPAGPGGA